MEKRSNDKGLLRGLSIPGLSRKKDKKTESDTLSKETKSAFLTNMSHELRTPINIMLGMNEMILRESKDKDILPYAENVKNAGNILIGIINDILDFSKIEAGKLEILPAPYDLSLLLFDLVNSVKCMTLDKGLELDLDFDKTIPRKLEGDEVRIKQAAMNLLSNAVKFTFKGSIKFIVSYERIPEEPDFIMLNIKVDDTGIGIKPEDLEKLFSEFERIDDERTKNTEGAGLGLCITKRLVEMMGGSLVAESLYNVGSIFSFSIRQKVTEWEALGDYEVSGRQELESRTAYKEKFTAPRADILIVDDSYMNLVVLQSLLKQTLIRIDTAESGNEAIIKAMNKKYDIIFLDHMMPDMDGIETLHELKNQSGSPNRDTVAICLTANAISGARQLYLSEGFDDYLTKPLDTDALEKMLMKYIPDEKIEKISENNPGSGASRAEKQAPKLPEKLRALEDCELIDANAGLKNSGSEEAYISLLKIFYTSIDEKSRSLDKFFAQGDLRNYTIMVHALKSSSRIIGAETFGAAAQELESAGKREDMEYISSNHNGFMSDYRSFKDTLSLMFPDIDSGADKPKADQELMQDVFSSIRSAAEDMDCDRLNDIFAEMEAYSIPEKDAPLWSELKIASDNYDYNKVLKLLV